MSDSQVKGQRGRVLRAFLEAPGREVPLPELLKIAAQYSARIFELRAIGFRITNRTATIAGVKHSWFRLESVPTRKLETKGSGNNADLQQNLFDVSRQHNDLG